MRVLHVLESTLGGTRRYLEDVHAALGPGDNYGLVYSLHRADAQFRGLLNGLRRSNWQLYKLGMEREIRPMSDLSCVRAMRGIYRAFQPDLVHAHSSKAGAIARLATLGVANRPRIVYTPHSIAANISPLYGAIEKLLAVRLDVLTAVTHSERDELCRLRLVPPERTFVAVPAVDPAHFVPQPRAAARKKLGLGNAPLVVAVGRLSPQKDPLAFAALIALLRERIPSVQALWIGDGELRRDFEACIAALGLESCLTLTGWSSDVRPYLAAADMVASMSRYESFGYVVAEAHAMQRPVIATAIAGTVDIVTVDAEHQLFQRENLAAAADLAERFLTDPAFAEQIGKRARANVLSMFSIQETRRGLTKAYDAALRRAPSPLTQFANGVGDVEESRV